MEKRKISERIKELLRTATPRQKALILCKEYLEKDSMNEPKTITDEEADAIIDSFSDPGEAKEYNKWVKTYNVYSELTPLFGLVFKEYQTEAERVLGYLRQWEDYIQEEEHLNTIYQDLLNKGDGEALETFSQSLKHINFFNARLKRDKEGYIEIDIAPLYQRILSKVNGVIESYQAAKAIVIVTERYTRSTKSAAFRPQILINAIDMIKEDYSLNIAPKYSRKRLKEAEEKGNTITKAERMRAVFPYYEEIEAPERLLNMFEDKLKAIIKNV